jgi:hypothetical protein
MKHLPEYVAYYNQSHFFPHQRFPPISVHLAQRVMKLCAEISPRQIEHWGTCRPSLLACLAYGLGADRHVIGIQVFENCFVDPGLLAEFKEECGIEDPPWETGLPVNASVGVWHEFSPSTHFSRIKKPEDKTFLIDAKPETMAGLEVSNLGTMLFKSPDKIRTDFVVVCDLDPELRDYMSKMLPHHTEREISDSLSHFHRDSDAASLDPL